MHLHKKTKKSLWKRAREDHVLWIHPLDISFNIKVRQNVAYSRSHVTNKRKTGMALKQEFQKWDIYL